MKLRSTTPVSNGLVTKSIIVAAAVLMVVATPFATQNIATARNYDAEINALQGQIDQYQSEAKKLSKKADSLQNELAGLEKDKATIQAQIDLSQAKYDKLQVDIKKTEKEIEKNKVALGKIIADIYTDDAISPLEMLASSNDIGDYLDKQEYRSSVSSSLQETISKVKQLRAELEQQKIDTKRVLADQNNAKGALVAKEQEQANLLAQTKNDEASYDKLTSAAQSQKLQVMQSQQDAITRAMSRAGGGGMISAGGSLSSYTAWAGDCYVDGNAWSHGGAGGNGQDPLGYGCNQCVSYTAWKIMQVTGGYGPSYWGNANMWPNSARGAGFKVGYSQPAPGQKAIGIISAGEYGHAVFVEASNPAAGTVDISQYNEYLPGQGWGHYSTRSGVSASTYDTYIYL